MNPSNCLHSAGLTPPMLRLLGLEPIEMETTGVKKIECGEGRGMYAFADQRGANKIAWSSRKVQSAKVGYKRLLLVVPLGPILWSNLSYILEQNRGNDRLMIHHPTESLAFTHKPYSLYHGWATMVHHINSLRSSFFGQGGSWGTGWCLCKCCYLFVTSEGRPPVL